MSSASPGRRLAAWALGLAALLAVAALSPEPAAAQGGDFVAEVADLPLMPGLSEVEGAGVVFDKPSGRIVEAYAQGAVTREAVLRFYKDTLPQLGWRESGAASFRREGERLALEFIESKEQGGGPLTLRFVLKPE